MEMRLDKELFFVSNKNTTCGYSLKMTYKYATKQPRCCAFTSKIVNYQNSLWDEIVNAKIIKYFKSLQIKVGTLYNIL